MLPEGKEWVVGDEVACRSGYTHYDWSIQPLSRITTNHLYVGDLMYRRNGVPVTRSTAGGRIELFEVTDGIRQEIKRERRIVFLTHFNWDMLSNNTLECIIQILEKERSGK